MDTGGRLPPVPPPANSYCSPELGTTSKGRSAGHGRRRNAHAGHPVGDTQCVAGVRWAGCRDRTRPGALNTSALKSIDDQPLPEKTRNHLAQPLSHRERSLPPRATRIGLGGAQRDPVLEERQPHSGEAGSFAISDVLQREVVTFVPGSPLLDAGDGVLGAAKPRRAPVDRIPGLIHES